MRLPTENRSDFVIGMSLAEVVILLLFCFFLASALPKEGKEGQDVSLRLRMLEEENEELKKQNSSLQAKLEEIRQELQSKLDLIEQLRNMVGAQGTDLSDFDRAIIGLKRGHPICLKDNTLIEVRARHGTVDVVILLVNPELERFLGKSDIHFQKGEILSDTAKIDAFLNSVWKYEREKECRFDYRLKYATPDDYYAAREKFERFLYPERIVHIAQ